MITADMARQLSGDGRVDEALENFECRIREACENGERSAMLVYCGSMDGARHAALEALRRNGFEVLWMGETDHGAKRAPGWYARW